MAGMTYCTPAPAYEPVYPTRLVMSLVANAAASGGAMASVGNSSRFASGELGAYDLKIACSSNKTSEIYVKIGGKSRKYLILIINLNIRVCVMCVRLRVCVCMCVCVSVSMFVCAFRAYLQVVGECHSNYRKIR